LTATLNAKAHTLLRDLFLWKELGMEKKRMINKKNLLIYAHYYIPDTASTGQILCELAESMLDKFNITIICVVPSYLKGYTLTGVREDGLRTKDGREVVFAFIGAGSVLQKLVQYSNRHHFENIVFIPYQDKADLVYSLNAGDVHWCVNAKGIKGVSCPSNVYSTNRIDVASSKRTCFAHHIGC